jgi:hypothetical protein
MNINYEQIESYVVAEDDGTEHIVIVEREVRIGMFAGKKIKTFGKIIHKFENGNHVNVLADGFVEDFVTGKKMRRV